MNQAIECGSNAGLPDPRRVPTSDARRLASAQRPSGQPLGRNKAAPRRECRLVRVGWLEVEDVQSAPYLILVVLETEHVSFELRGLFDREFSSVLGLHVADRSARREDHFGQISDGFDEPGNPADDTLVVSVYCRSALCCGDLRGRRSASLFDLPMCLIGIGYGFRGSIA